MGSTHFDEKFEDDWNLPLLKILDIYSDDYPIGM